MDVRNGNCELLKNHNLALLFRPLILYLFRAKKKNSVFPPPLPFCRPLDSPRTAHSPAPPVPVARLRNRDELSYDDTKSCDSTVFVTARCTAFFVQAGRSRAGCVSVSVLLNCCVSTWLLLRAIMQWLVTFVWTGSLMITRSTNVGVS